MAVVSDTGEYKDSICIAALCKIMDNDMNVICRLQSH